MAEIRKVKKVGSNSIKIRFYTDSEIVLNAPSPEERAKWYLAFNEIREAYESHPIVTITDSADGKIGG